MKKVFYVCDSYLTGTIAEEIRKAFPESTVYTDSTIFSVAKDWPTLTEQNLALKLTTETTTVKDVVNERVDFFILSAKLIYDGSVNPADLKKKYGHNDSKIIAVSMTSYFLDMTSKLVDLQESKDIFIYHERITKFFGGIK